MIRALEMEEIVDGRQRWGVFVVLGQMQTSL